MVRLSGQIEVEFEDLEMASELFAGVGDGWVVA